MRGEIFLAMFPFGDVPGMKLRPVLALTERVGQHPEVLVAYISSVVPAMMLASDILLDPNTSENQQTNLKVVSVLRLHKLATIHHSAFARKLGSLPPRLMSDVSQKLRVLLQL